MVRQDGKRRDAEGAVPVAQWRIHIGAHKTATTHLQETLSSVRDGLADCGIDFIPTQPLVRAQRLAEVVWQRRPMARLPIFGPAHMRDAIETLVEPVRIGPETVVLSEENLLGLPHHILTAPFYPQATQRIGRLASLGLRADLRLFLSIRSYDTLLPSAYAEALKHAAPPPGGFEGLRQRLLAAPPSWFDLVSRLRAAAPNVPLRVWRQEDYRANDRSIMEMLCGSPLGPLPKLPDPARTRTPSAAAIAVAEALPADLSYQERLARVREIYTVVEPREARFQPFDKAERRRLRAGYEADLERIARVFPDMLMAFETRELAA
jgi:hypothetical protein